MINNQFGTIVAMTHILLPFMILPMYSVMQTIPPSYLRAAKSLGATNWTAFWRVYFPQSVPGIGAGSILVFILPSATTSRPKSWAAPRGRSSRTGSPITSRLAQLGPGGRAGHDPAGGRADPLLGLRQDRRHRQREAGVR
jgi:putative spermidine/putrescine transport system permease protein